METCVTLNYWNHKLFPLLNHTFYGLTRIFWLIKTSDYLQILHLDEHLRHQKILITTICLNRIEISILVSSFTRHFVQTSCPFLVYICLQWSCSLWLSFLKFQPVQILLKFHVHYFASIPSQRTSCRVENLLD